MGIARSFQIPQPFGGMTVFENLVVAAAFGGGRRERDVYGRCAELLERCGLADKANRRAGSLTLLDRKRLELARALATEPRVLLLDEVAGGLVEHETAALVELVKQVRASGVSIVWIEHIVHALIAAVDEATIVLTVRDNGSGFPPAVLAGLAAKGVTLRPGQGEDSGVHAVMIRNGEPDGGYDPRREGRVLVEALPPPRMKRRSAGVDTHRVGHAREPVPAQ